MLRHALFVCLAFAVSAVAGTFDPVPAAPGGKPSGLQLRVVTYDGSVNGAITVEVKNPTASPLDFTASGLFFVPDVDPDQAPQRLGAVGGLVHQKVRAEKLSIAGGATEKLTLDVYCIDSHRPSPSSSTPFRVAKARLPPQLAQDIDTNTKNAAASYGGVPAPAAKSAVQSEVWKSRDSKWIKLDGEGKQEAGK